MRIRRAVTSLTLILAACAARPAAAAAPAGDGDEKDLVKASLIADAETVAPGTTFTLGLKMVIKPHWHTYWVNPGEAGDATQVSLKGPDGFSFGPIQWPLPSLIDAPGGVTYGYENEVMLLIPVTVSRSILPAGLATIEADATWMSCKETCIEGGAKLSITLPVAPLPKAANREAFAAWRGRLPAAKAEGVAKVDQPKGPDGKPAASLVVEWAQAPKSVQWFPASTRAVAIENVVVKHDGRRTTIAYKPTVFQADGVPGGRVESVLAYEDASGVRRGVAVPFAVPVPNGADGK